MVRLEERKSLTRHLPIEILPPPRNAYIPLIQHIGKPCTNLVVAARDSVTKGQKIATAQAQIFSPVHASVSGEVTAIQPWPHPVLNRCQTIVIAHDGKDETANKDTRSDQEIARLTADEIRHIVFEAGVVGMGGASFPTHVKLNPPKPVDTLIINGAECEPYLTADDRLMVEKTNEIVKGITLIAKCLNATTVYIAIEDNKPEAIAAFQHAIRNTQYSIRTLKSQYPQGGEKQLIKNVLHKEVPRGKLPFDVGISVQNVATVFAVYEAVYLYKSLFERVVTVTGSCIANPKNLLVRIGTPIQELINACGPLDEEPAKIIIGGPMMGIAQYTDLVPVIKSTNGIILMNAQEAEELKEQPCIRCGACVRECPAGLMPCLINLACEKNLMVQAKEYGALDCIECGICNYVCPASRNLLQTIKRAKLEPPK
ncbi:MAG: electron transport complex subunit RsxC [Candidatus Omnitrophota bacterium]|jgi:electron transport complex protein RnfC|nr:MAG: electron transport complex subunit RsxC [Candidatus Omnitrophota bacterium]